MKYLISFAALLLLGGCVPFKAYKERKEYYKSISLMRDTIFQDYFDLKYLHDQLTIDVNLVKKNIEVGKERNNYFEIRLNKKLKKLGVESQLDLHNMGGLFYHSPFYGEKMFNEFMKKNTCRDPDIARNINWLSEKEKETYYWLNYARMYPKEFCDLYIIPLNNAMYYKNNRYIISLIDYMYSMKPLNALTPDKQAYESARCHAESSGKNGVTGHRRSKECPDRTYYECIDYNKFDARDHIVRLLINLNCDKLNYRYNLLDLMSSAGIAYAIHSEYEEILVIDLLRK